MVKITKKELDDILEEIVRLHHKLGQFGMYKTMHAMHEVIRKSGWEAAEIIEGKHPTKFMK